MADLVIERGDYGFYVQGTITDADGSVFDLSGYTLTFQAWEKGNWERPMVAGTAAAVVATEGTWRYLVQQNDFIKIGEFMVAVRATKVGARETTRTYTLEIEGVP